MGKTRAENSLPASVSSRAGSCRRCRKSSYARRAACNSTTSPSCQALPTNMAKRLTVAPSGRVIRKRPSRTRASGLRKIRCSSVNASGSSITARADRETSSKPAPSEAVSESGASGAGATGTSTFVPGCPVAAPGSSTGASSRNPRIGDKRVPDIMANPLVEGTTPKTGKRS